MRFSKILLSAVFCVTGCIANAAAQGAGGNPLFLGQFGVSRIYAGQEAELSRADSGWKAERSEVELSLSNSDYGKDLSVRSVKFAEKIKLTKKSNDFVESYLLFGSRPSDRTRLIYKVERSIDYPKSFARPRSDDLVAGLHRKWGHSSATLGSASPKPGETVTYYWYFAHNGLPLDRNQGCDAIMANAKTIVNYRLENLPAVEEAEKSVCNAFVSATVTVDQDGFVEKTAFTAYSNFAHYRALKSDQAFLQERLEDVLERNAPQRRRILDIPRL